jgi:hypothetical protein
VIENSWSASQISFSSNVDFEADLPLSALLELMLNSTLLGPSFDVSKLGQGVRFVDVLYSPNIERGYNSTAGLLLYKLPPRPILPDNDGLDRSKAYNGLRRLLLGYKRRHGECWLGSDNPMLRGLLINHRKSLFRSKRLVWDVWPGGRRRPNDKSLLLPSLSITSLRYRLYFEADSEGRWLPNSNPSSSVKPRHSSRYNHISEELLFDDNKERMNRNWTMLPIISLLFKLLPVELLLVDNVNY